MGILKKSTLALASVALLTATVAVIIATLAIASAVLLSFIVCPP